VKASQKSRRNLKEKQMKHLEGLVVEKLVWALLSWMFPWSGTQLSYNCRGVKMFSIAEHFWKKRNGFLNRHVCVFVYFRCCFLF
jgi:hypothetical protein